MSVGALLASHFTGEADPNSLPPYFRLGAQPLPVGTAAMDSSDQAVLVEVEET